MLPVTADAAERSETKLLHSFGRDFRPWSEYARSIKASLEKDSPWPLDLQEHTLLTARFNKPGPEAPFVEYLNSLYHDQSPDIVLSLGAPAAAFVQKYRDRLFPGSPLVLTVVEDRLISRASLTGKDTVISVRNDFLTVFKSVLHVLPDTQTIAVVIGSSALEKFWLSELKRETASSSSRLSWRPRNMIGANCGVGASARAICLRAARSCFASQVSGHNIAGSLRS